MQIEADRPWWRRDGDDWLLSVRVQPNARRTEVAGEYDGQLRVRLAAPPADGRANAALLRFLAAELGVSRSALTLTRGGTARSKVVRITGTG